MPAGALFKDFPFVLKLLQYSTRKVQTRNLEVEGRATSDDQTASPWFLLTEALSSQHGLVWFAIVASGANDYNSALCYLIGFAYGTLSVLSKVTVYNIVTKVNKQHRCYHDPCALSRRVHDVECETCRGFC